MRKSTLQFLLSSFLVFFLFVSCSTYNFGEGYKERMAVKDIYQNPYFSDATTDYVYKANITVYGNELTGIFIAKKINDTTHRVVFTTEFGNKLLDFEVSETGFRINSIVEELNRKILVKTLEKDFRLLLKTEFPIAEAFEKEGNIVYRSPQGKLANYIFVAADGKLSDIVQASRTKEKIKISFTSENNIFAQQIVIQHYDLKLRMTFNYFKEN